MDIEGKCGWIIGWGGGGGVGEWGGGGGVGGGKGYVGPPKLLGVPASPCPLLFLRLCCHAFIGRNDVYLPYDVAVRA